jgi:short-subunit dehydrogenase
MPTSHETVLITGPSSGIGLELARLFAADRSDLILVARSEDKLQSLANELRTAHGITVDVRVRDLSIPGSAQALFDELERDGRQVDVVVNNAGFGKMARFVDVDADTYARMVELNVATLTLLTRLFLPGMIARGRGGVLNLASTASFQPGPNCAAYYASKAFVRSLSEAIAEELRGTGVTVTALCPGPTKTGFSEVADMDDMLLFKFAMDVQPVALAGYRAFRRGATVKIPGVGNKLLAWSSKVFPSWIVRKVVKAMQPVERPETGQ